MASHIGERWGRMRQSRKTSVGKLGSHLQTRSWQWQMNRKLFLW
jgi:hypothetical protein